MKRVGRIFLSVFLLAIFTLNLSFAQESQDGASYLDSTKFKPALDLIKDDPGFSIAIGIVEEYSLTVKNKVTGEETNSIIMQSSNADFEDYCLNVLGIDLPTTLGVKLSEKYKELEKTYTVRFAANGGAGNMDAVSNIFGTYELPSNGFTAPSGKEFKGWSERANGEVITGNNITVSGDITLYAIWGDLNASEPDNCKNLSDYPLTNCPDGAMCSSIVCGNERKYKFERCQDDYVLENGECKCGGKDYTMSATLDGRYGCRCHQYPGMCYLSIGATRYCNGKGYCDTQRYMNGVRENEVSFVLDDKRAKAVGIENIGSKRILKRVCQRYYDEYECGYLGGEDGWYFSPEDCESMGKEYFSEAGKEIEVDVHEDTCESGCQCVDLDKCPENMKNECLKSCGNNKKEVWETCSSCPQDLGNECMGKKISLNSDRLTPDNLASVSKGLMKEECENNYNYSLTECPTGAVCSYCKDTTRYKFERCQSGYTLENGECKCGYTMSAVLDGKYSCQCHQYPGMCYLSIGATRYCNGKGYCDTHRYYGILENVVSFTLDDKRAKAVGIENIGSKRISKRVCQRYYDEYECGYLGGEDGWYFSPEDCEDMGKKYFSEAGKELEVTVYEDTCESGCQCADWNNCPEKLKKQCESLCGNGRVDDGETCSNCPADVKEGCRDVCDEISKIYPLTECPEGAVCSFVQCKGVYRYKIDSCNDNYDLVKTSSGNSCQCNQEYTMSAALDGRYSCKCPYSDMCWLSVGATRVCNGKGYCDTQRYMNGVRENAVGFTLDDKWAKAVGIKNITSKRINKTVCWHDNYSGERVCGPLGGEDTWYFSPEDCESMGKEYFSEAGKEIEVTIHEDKVCTPGCPCADLKKCPEELKKRC